MADEELEFRTPETGLEAVVPQSTGATFSEAGEIDERIQLNKTDKRWESIGLISHDSGFGGWDPNGEDTGILGAMGISTVEGPWARKAARVSLERDLDARGVKKLKKEELNKRYPHMNFESDMHEQTAQMLADEKERTDKWQALINRGPETGVLFDLGAGALQGLTDPMNYLLGFATGGALAATRFGLKLAPTALRGLRTTFAVNALENAAIEFGSLPGLTEEGRTDVNWKTAAVSTVLGGAVATLPAAGKKFFGKKVVEDIDAEAKRVEADVPAPVVKEAVATAIAQTELGRKVNVKSILGKAYAYSQGRVKFDDMAPYEFREIADVVDEREFHIGVDPEGGAVAGGGKRLGEGGVVALDDPNIARGFGGDVVTISAKDARLVDIDQDFTQPVSQAVISKVSKALNLEIPMNQFDTLGDFIERVQTLVDRDVLPESAMKVVEDAVKEQGFDGYKWVKGTVDDDYYNGIYLFDEKKAQYLGMAEKRGDGVLEAEAEDGDVDVMTRLDDPKEHAHYTPAVEEEIRQAKAELSKVESDSDITSEISRVKAQAQAALQRYKAAFPEASKFIDRKMQEVEENLKNKTKELESLRALGDCTHKRMT